MRSSVAEFFKIDRVGRHDRAGEDEVLFIGNGPLDDFALGELQRLGNRRGEVDIELLAVLALDELNFGWITHA